MAEPETEPFTRVADREMRKVRGGKERGDASRLQVRGTLRGVRNFDAGNHPVRVTSEERCQQ